MRERADFAHWLLLDKPITPAWRQGTTSRPMTLDECRRFYAQEIRYAAGLRSPRLIQAFATVPREKYLGSPPWRIVHGQSLGSSKPPVHETSDPCDLCHNVLVSIDEARRLNNGQPGALALWLAALDLKPGDRVFHLGCGVGYYTAIMAEVVGPEGSVVAIEVLPELAERSRANLSGYAHVAVHASDGSNFDPGDCDVIFINAGVTHPERAWLDRLKDMGRLVLPLTATPPGAASPGSGGVMIRIVRQAGGFSAQVISAVAIYPCTTTRDRELDDALGKAMKAGRLHLMKSVRCDAHEPANTCLVHGPQACLSTLELPRLDGGN